MPTTYIPYSPVQANQNTYVSPRPTPQPIDTLALLRQMMQQPQQQGQPPANYNPTAMNSYRIPGGSGVTPPGTPLPVGTGGPLPRGFDIGTLTRAGILSPELAQWVQQPTSGPQRFVGSQQYSANQQEVINRLAQATGVDRSRIGGLIQAASGMGTNSLSPESLRKIGGLPQPFYAQPGYGGVNFVQQPMVQPQSGNMQVQRPGASSNLGPTGGGGGVAGGGGGGGWFGMLNEARNARRANFPGGGGGGGAFNPPSARPLYGGYHVNPTATPIAQTLSAPAEPDWMQQIRQLKTGGVQAASGTGTSSSGAMSLGGAGGLLSKTANSSLGTPGVSQGVLPSRGAMTTGYDTQNPDMYDMSQYFT